MVNSSPITYTLDLAAPLVTVLADDDGSAWIYLSGCDALNSVRQEKDAGGQVLAARSFDPYGVPLSGDGGVYNA